MCIRDSFGSDLDIFNGNANNSSEPNAVTITREYFFLDIPVLIRRQFGGEKLSFFVEGGVSPNLFIVTKTKQVLDNEDVSRMYDKDNVLNIRSLQFVASLSFGVNYNIADKWQLFAQPVARYSLSTIRPNVPVNENLYTIGLEIGLRKFL